MSIPHIFMSLLLDESENIEKPEDSSVDTSDSELLFSEQLSLLPFLIKNTL